jgi:chloramphenicol-sensitive protein RarD
MNRGVVLAIGAYLIWGFIPIYFKILDEVPALQILGHRAIWSFVFLVVLILFRKEWRDFLRAISSRKTLLFGVLAAVLLTINWLTYIWGVNNGFIVETSLGYFINPLVSVVLGVVFLREKLRLFQWIAVSVAAIGVLYLTISYGALPWIALSLAFSFGSYGLAKKTSALNSLKGLTLETGILFIPMLAFLVVSEVQGVGVFGHPPFSLSLLLAFSGVVSGIPLLLFGGAAQRINLTTMGILQYIAPTCQFLIGVFLYREPFTLSRLVGFLIIWLALIIFTTEGFFQHRRHTVSVAA